MISTPRTILSLKRQFQASPYNQSKWTHLHEYFNIDSPAIHVKITEIIEAATAC